MQFYVRVKGKKLGPFSQQQILSSKNINRDTLIWHKGLKKWTKAENIDFFKEKFTSINIKPTKNKQT